MMGKETSDHLPTWTTDPNVATKLQINSNNETLMTIPELLKKTAEEFPQQPALVFEDLFHTWKTVTFSQYHARVENIAKAFIRLGLEPRHSVGVLAPNCPEWFYSELAAISAGGMAAGIYTTNSAEAIFHVLEKARANIVIVDDTQQLDKVMSIKQRLPLLKAVVQIQPPYASYVRPEDGYYRWPELEKMEVNSVEEEYRRRLEKIRVNEAAVLIFTVSC